MQLLHTFGGCSVSRSCRNVACTFSTCEHELLQKSTQLGTILRQHLPCTAPAYSFESCCCTHPAVTAMCCAVVEPLPANMSSSRKEVLMGEEGERKCPHWRLRHSAPCRLEKSPCYPDALRTSAWTSSWTALRREQMTTLLLTVFSITSSSCHAASTLLLTQQTC